MVKLAFVFMLLTIIGRSQNKATNPIVHKNIKARFIKIEFIRGDGNVNLRY